MCVCMPSINLHVYIYMYMCLLIVYFIRFITKILSVFGIIAGETPIGFGNSEGANEQSVCIYIRVHLHAGMHINIHVRMYICM